MGAYSKVVSVLRQIDTAHTFIGGTKADITSAWTFVNGEIKQVFPSSEYYTQIYTKTDAGAYSETLPYGRYKIVVSGAGGSGGASASTHETSYNWAAAGSAGEETTIMLDVPFGTTKNVSGILGQGGRASYAYATKNSLPTATLGAGGTGYASGGQGTRDVDVNYISAQIADAGAAAGGAGGGSSSISIDSATPTVVKGGNGGSCRAYLVSARTGGTGGSGGITTGTGAAGGAGRYTRLGGGYSTAGTDGYIRIYQSSIYPN